MRMQLGLMFLCLLPLGAQASQYKLDTAHTNVGFKVDHLVISSVTGRFDTFTGTFEYDEKTKQLKNVAVSIEAKSINTNEPDRDKHLRSPDFFDVEKFPKLEFASAGAKQKGKQVTLPAEITIHGVKKKITLNVTIKGTIKDPWGNEHLVFAAEAKVNRKDFGLNWNKKLDHGGLMIGDEVEIQISGEALQKKS